MVIGIVSTKGGSGKSTIAINLSCWLAKKKNKEVMLIDADSQESSIMFSNIQSEAVKDEELPFSTVAKTGPALKDVIKAFKSKYDYIVIDTGGKNTAEAKTTLLYADLVIIPIVPSQIDVDAFDKITLSTFSDAKIFNENLLGLVVPYMASTHPKDKNETSLRNFLKEIEEETDGIGIYENKICERNAFRKSIEEGKSVFYASNPDQKAISEAEALFEEIINIEKIYI